MKLPYPRKHFGICLLSTYQNILLQNVNKTSKMTKTVTGSNQLVICRDLNRNTELLKWRGWVFVWPNIILTKMSENYISYVYLSMDVFSLQRGYMWWYGYMFYNLNKNAYFTVNLYYGKSRWNAIHVNNYGMPVDQYKFTVILGHTKWLIDQRITCDGKAHADIQCLESFTWAFKGTLTLVRGVRAAPNYE